MIEMMLSRGSIPFPYYPNSGPGTKYLRAGNTDFGYFGEVPESNLPIIRKILNQLNNPLSETYTPDPGNIWLKFFYKNRILFLPMFQVATANFTTIWNSRMMYSLLNAGTALVPNKNYNGLEPYTQAFTLDGPENTTLLVRSLELSPTAFDVASAAVPPSGEFLDLIVKTFSPSASYPSPIGVKLSEDILKRISKNGTYPWEVYGSGASNSSLAGAGFIAIPANANFAQVAQLAFTVNSSWMPVVQILNNADKTKLGLPVTDMAATSDVTYTQPMSNLSTDGYAQQARGLRSPGGYTEAVPNTTWDSLYPPVSTAAFGTNQSVSEQGQVSIIDVPQYPPYNVNVPVQNSGEVFQTVGDLAIQPESIFEGCAQGNTSGWVNGDWVYLCYGHGGSAPGGTESQYPKYISAFNWKTKAVAQVSTLAISFTWNSGVRVVDNYYVMNGYTPSGYSSSVYQVSATAPGAPVAKTAAPGTTRTMPQVCALTDRGTLFRTGGAGSNNVAVNDAAIYNPTNNTWSNMAAPGVGVFYACCGYLNNKVYVIGGASGNPSAAVRNTTVRIYDVNANTWSTLANPYGSFSCLGQAIPYGSFMLAFGIANDISSASLSVLILNTSNNTFRVKFLGFPTRLLGMVTLGTDGMIWIGGGSTLFAPIDWDNNLPWRQIARFDPAKIVAT